MKFIWSYLLVLAVMGMVVSVQAQEPKEPSEDLRAFIKAQQSKMDELSKVLEEQKLVIQAQSKLLEEQKGLSTRQLEGNSKDKASTLEMLLKQEGEQHEFREPVSPGKSKGVKVEWGKDGRLNFKNEDGSLSSHFGIMMQYDSSFYNASDSTQDLLFSNNDLNQGSAFRRARIRSDGTAYEIMEWVFEMDFSRAADLRKNTINPGNTLPGLQEPLSNIMFNNMWVGFKNIPLLGTFRAGHIKEDLSYYSAGSGRTIPFMERPSVWDAIEDPYLFSNGITLSRNYMDDMIYSWIGLFQTNTRVGAFNVSNTATLAFDARLCVMPIYDEENNHWLNLGAAGSVRANPNEIDTDIPAILVNVQPLVRAGSSFQVPNIINTRPIYTLEGTELFVLCANYANGPFSFGAQYDAQIFNNSYVGGDISKPVNGLPGGAKPVGDLYFDGFSVEALCFLTRGDYRGTNKNNPMYVQVIPQNPLSYGHGALNGTGAWEVGVRFDFVNTMINVPDEAKPRGGYLSSTTLGLNWFLNANTTFMANYVYSSGYFGTDTERGAPGDGAFHAFGTRVMFIF
ncbi:MAG: porin [Planctomycetia bacterium]|jgi:phosphate-selective porin OprO/OprP